MTQRPPLADNEICTVLVAEHANTPYYYAYYRHRAVFD